MTRIARELGVSAMTISNAYNHPERLTPALRERVLETARQFGYPGPDPLGRGLRRGRVGTIGVLYDNLLSYAFRDQAAVLFLSGLSTAAEEEGLGLTLVPGSPRGDRDAAVVGRMLVDGLAVYSVADDDPVLIAALDRTWPMVLVDQPRIAGLPLVGIDDEAAAHDAAQHLIDLGHRRFAVVSFGLGPDLRHGLADEERQRSAAYHVSRARLAGFKAALTGHGIPWSKMPVFECPGSSQDLGRAAADALLGAVPTPTAILATSDELALGVLDAAKRRGLSVPGDLSVVGFDDVPAAATATSPLTTISQDHAAKGRLAGQMLVALLRGEAVSSPQHVPTRLVVRTSTARPPEDGP